MEYVLLFRLFSGIVVFCLTRKHFLLSLLRLEFIVLSIFLCLFIYIYIYIYGYELYISLIFLVFTVCEGVLGLSVLVRLVRRQGNDYLSRISILSW